MIDRIITYSFYLLFFLTPLFWTSLNFELFEYNKMILVYGFTVIIVGAWLLKTINDKRLTIKRTPLDIPLLLFLGANILSTIFSIDPHTSVWGYYSRSNGGLLSLISYLLLYWAFVSNITAEQIGKLLKIGLISGLIISIWGISEHFGVSPSCIILRGQFSANCWVQDVQSRVFATLGQPNWLAAYLSMLIFPALYFFLTATTKKLLITCYLLLVTLYLAFTFTYSRGPTLGLIGGFLVFMGLQILNFHPKGVNINLAKLKPILIVLLGFGVINLLFGSALTNFRLIAKFAPPPRPAISLPIVPQSGTQLETGGTESGQIRFIVWKGALDIFKNYPIFGSGVETFAYSYYQFRPAAHNMTSEWDFLYNKAHNEYLNYLATTGLVGFATYITIIMTFIIWSLRIQSSEFRVQNKIQSLKSKILNSKFNSEFYILNSALLASYISYLIYNFFLFSVVAIAIFFYLFPALAFVATDSTKLINIKAILEWQPIRSYLTFRDRLLNTKFKITLAGILLASLVIFLPLRKITLMLVLFLTLPLSFIILPYHELIKRKKATSVFVIFLIFGFIINLIGLWNADALFARGERASELGNPGRAYNLLTTASDLNRDEPFYRSEKAYAASQASVALQETEATLSAALKDEAIKEIEEVLRSNPKNVSFWRTAVRTYFELASIDQKYINKTLEALDQAITLAPTDPKLYYNKALILESQNQKEEAVKALQKAIELKPNYQEALVQLKEATSSSKP